MLKCDRCGKEDFKLRGYGFADGENGITNKGYNLCTICSCEWDKFIRKECAKRGWKTSGHWHKIANKLLEDFVKMKITPEKVQFT